MSALRGRRLLLVEDEYFIANEMRRSFEDAGAVVLGPVGRVPDALRLIERERHIDGAVLDINLHDEAVYPVADVLSERNVPFVFASGYLRSGGAAPHAHVPRFEKPVPLEAVIEALFG